MDRIDLQPARRGPVQGGGSGLTLIALLLVVAALGASIGSDRSESLSEAIRSTSPRPTPGAPPSMVASPQAVAASVEDRPSWVDDLAAQLECESSDPTSLGTEVPRILEPLDPGRSPSEAQRIALITYSSLPVKGYAPLQLVGHWARHTYRVEGRIKVVMVSTDRWDAYPDVDGWEVVGIRACDLSEFRQADLAEDGPTIWYDSNGAPVVTEVALSFEGPEHCGWESTVFLRFRGEQFIRDPKHVLGRSTVVDFDASVRLPDDATDTGLHTDRWHLFGIPSGRAVFVRTRSGSVERWPRTKEEIGCA